MIRPGKHARLPRSSLDRTAPPPDSTEGTPPAHPPSGRWQFGLPALLGTMLLLCLPFAVWGAILRANPNEELALTLLCIALPLGVLFVASVSVSVARWARKPRPPKTADSAEDE